MKLKMMIFGVFLIFVYSSFSQNQSANELKEYVNNRDYEKAFQVVDQAVQENFKDQSILLLAGDVYTEMDNNQKALEVYEKAYELDRKNTEALSKYGRALSINSNHKEAIDLFENAVKKSPNDVKMRLNLANAYLATDSLNKAELIITQAREMDKNSPDAFIALGDLYQKQRVYELARMNFEEALELSPENIDARVKLAIAYFRLANSESDDELRNVLYNRSLEEWNKVTKQDPQNARAFYEQGRLLFFGEQYAGAAQSLYNFVQLRPSGTLGRWYLAQSLEKIGSCDSALVHLKVIADELDSVKVKANYLSALCLFDTKQYDKAIALFNSLSNDTTLANIDIQRLGQSYLFVGDTLKALETWNEAVNQSPEENCKIMNQMGILYQKLKMYDESINILKKRIDVGACEDEFQHIVYYYLGLSYVQSEQPELAIEPFSKSIEINPEFLFSRVYLADAYSAIQKFDEADSIFKSTIDIALLDTVENSYVLTQCYAKLAGSYLDRKKFNDVVKTGEDWSKIAPNEPYPYLYIAIAYHNLGNGKQACTNYRKVLKIDPKNASAAKNLKSLEDNNQCK